MKTDTTPMKVLRVVHSSTGYLGATDVDQTCGCLGFGYARMEVQRDAEQAMEHLLQAVLRVVGRLMKPTFGCNDIKWSDKCLVLSVQLFSCVDMLALWPTVNLTSDASTWLKE